MASAETEKQPSQADRLEAGAEAGPGAINQPANKSISSGDTEAEKEMITNSPPSEGAEERAQEEAKKQEKPVEATRSKARTGLLMLALCLAVFLAALDMTIITTALPTIAADFKSSQADYSWIGSAYLLAAASSTPTWGKISDIFGRKPIILIANVVFLVGSLICALSINVKMLLGGRVLQGIGGGGLIILVNICISDLFSMRSRGIYFAMVGMVWAIASALGPVLGGVFTQLVTWRWCFYINLPVDGIAFIILFLFLDIKTPTTPIIAGLKAIDWLGSLTVVGGTVMFLLGLEFGGVSFPWSSATTICLIIFGIVTIGVFFVIEGRIAQYPVIPLHIFSSRSNIAVLITVLCHGFVFMAGSYFLPLYFQAVLGATPLLSGVYLFPFVISLSIVSVGTGIFIRKTGRYNEPIWFGMFFLTLGFGLYINFPPYPSWPRLILFQIIAGIGVGPNFQAPLIALQSKIQPRDIAAATATFGFTRNLSTSMSVVIGGVIFTNRMQAHASSFAGLPPAIQQALASGSAGASTGVVGGLPDAQKTLVLDAYGESLQALWIFYTCMAFLGLGVSLLIGRRTLSKEHEVTKTGLDEQRDMRKERAEERKRISAGKDLEAGKAATTTARADNGDVEKDGGVKV